MNTTTTKLGLIGTIALAMIALPTYAGPARGRADAHRKPSANHRHDHRADYRGGRNDANFRIRIEPSRHPAPIRYETRYETRTETVLVEPAHYETRTQQVLVAAGRWQERVVPGKREWLRDSRGQLHEVQITPDRVERIWCPPVYETRTVRVLVPARYETRTVRVPVTVRRDYRTSTTRAAVGLGLRILGQVLNR